MLVKDLMKKPFIIEKDISLADAARMISNKNIGSLLFVSGGKIKGIVTERDLIKNFGKHDRISHIITRKVITIEPDATLDRALEVMRYNKIKRLPVVKDGRLVGIVALTNLMANYEALEEDFFFE